MEVPVRVVAIETIRKQCIIVNYCDRKGIEERVSAAVDNNEKYN